MVLAVCIAGSALVGLGRAWPGADPSGARGTTARLVLVALNIAAVIAVPVISGQLDRITWDRYNQGYNDAQRGGNDLGLVNRGEQVCNIAAYDAQGQPLLGVQLFDQQGRPLDVRCYGQQDITVPWVLGDIPRWNVFPLGERDRPARNAERRADLSDAALPTPDRATTPEVTNPLVPEAVEPEPTPRPDRDTRDRTGSRKDGVRQE